MSMPGYVPAGRSGKALTPAFAVSDVMVGIGTLLFLLSVWYAASWIFRRRMPQSRWFLRAAATTGVLSVICMEAGWVVAEVGRQPWIVHGVMRTPEAVGDYTSALWWLLGISTVIYAGMTVGAVVVLRSMARRWRAGETDLPSPYAPEVPEAREASR